jgi:hypothetical protein
VEAERLMDAEAKRLLDVEAKSLLDAEAKQGSACGMWKPSVWLMDAEAS